MLKNNRIVYLFLIFVLVITGFIFFNSSKDGKTSNESSQKIENIVKPLVEDTFGKKDKFDLDILVRKSAHVIEFAALGICVCSLTMYIRFLYKKHIFGYSLFYALAIGVTDEYIQSFTDRTSVVRDIIIDFSGAVFGMLIAFLIIKSFKKIKSQKKRKLYRF